MTLTRRNSAWNVVSETTARFRSASIAAPLQSNSLQFFIYLLVCCMHVYLYRGADKSLARPGRKQATTTEDFEFHISYL